LTKLFYVNSTTHTIQNNLAITLLKIAKHTQSLHILPHTLFDVNPFETELRNIGFYVNILLRLN